MQLDLSTLCAITDPELAPIWKKKGNLVFIMTVDHTNYSYNFTLHYIHNFIIHRTVLDMTTTNIQRLRAYKREANYRLHYIL